MSKRYDHIISAVASEVWALEPYKLRAMIGFLQLKVAGGLPDPATLAQIQASSQRAAARAEMASQSSGGSVAVLPLYGMIMQRGSMMGDISGPRGTSTEQFTQDFRKALANPNVQAIVIDIDSPGGTVSGVPELASEILAARKTKPVVAVSNSLCASAAYWIASACSEIYATPSSLTGSIGVYTAHEDHSGALEKDGVKVTLVSYGENKTAGHPYGPLDDAAHSDMKDRVAYYGDMFDSAVGKGRKVKKSDVQGKFGGGKVFNALKAKSSGMVDQIGTLDDVLAKYGVSRSAGGSRASFASRGVSAAVPVAAAVPAATKPECSCPCEGCVGGECEDCTEEDCSYEGCGCDSAQASASAAVNRAASAQAVSAHRARELELLALSAA